MFETVNSGKSFKKTHSMGHYLILPLARSNYYDNSLLANTKKGTTKTDCAFFLVLCLLS